MRFGAPFSSTEQLKGQEDRVFILFNGNEQNKVRLATVSAGNHKALFQLLHNGEYKGVMNLSNEDLEGSKLYKLSNTVKYGDLRNLKRDAELEELFNTFTKHIYDTLEKGQAEDFLNNNEGFRTTLKNIRKGPLFFEEAKIFLKKLPSVTSE